MFSLGSVSDNFTDTESSLEAEVTRRRNQACRSLLIQVYSSKSHNDLYNYCSRFGDILSMHHYQINNQHNYILLEFKDIASIDEVMLSASFVNGDYIAPVKSPVLWFRKGQIVGQKNNQKKVSLSVENGCTFLTDQEIANMLYNAKSVSYYIYDWAKRNSIFWSKWILDNICMNIYNFQFIIFSLYSWNFYIIYIYKIWNI